jgi:hypothetical protein
MYSPMSFNLCAAIGSTPLARLRLTIALQNPSISDASSNVNNPLSQGCLPSVVKIRNTGWKEPVCPDQPPKRLTVLVKSLQTPPPHLYPENPPNPP